MKKKINEIKFPQIIDLRKNPEQKSQGDEIVSQRILNNRVEDHEENFQQVMRDLYQQNLARKKAFEQREQEERIWQIEEEERRAEEEYRAEK